MSKTVAVIQYIIKFSVIFRRDSPFFLIQENMVIGYTRKPPHVYIAS